MQAVPVAAVSLTTSSVWTMPSVPLTPTVSTDVSVVTPTTTTTAPVQTVRIVVELAYSCVSVRAANFAQVRHQGSQVLLDLSLSLEYCPAHGDVFVQTVKNSVAMCQYVAWTCVTDITHRVTTPVRRMYTCEKFISNKTHSNFFDPCMKIAWRLCLQGKSMRQ